MPEKIDLFYCGDAGNFDRHNPLYLFKQKWVPEILFEIANSNRYELTGNDIASRLNIPTADIDDVLTDMKNIGMVSEDQTGYAISFSTILEKDISIIDEFSRPIALKLGEKIIGKTQELKKLVSKIKCLDEYGYRRILYHVIGCDILDGTAINEFAGSGILKIS
ncbi:MAG: hypothetical protein KAR40_08800 [Candidatus Sabulitectum sp.]|nr:hypothetical protein [Candidatus Sabulitectum sp.]